MISFPRSMGGFREELEFRVAARLNRRGRCFAAIVEAMERRDYERVDRLCSQWLAVRPSDVGIGEQYAFSAHHRGLYAEAKRRWAQLLALAPNLAMAHCGLACNHRELGELDEAAVVMMPALAAFPRDPGLAGEAERIAKRLPPGVPAARLWAGLLAGDPDNAGHRGAYAEALAGIGRFAEASAEIDALLERTPTAIGLLTRGIHVALAGGNPMKAAALHDRLPKAATHTPELERLVLDHAAAIAASAAEARSHLPEKSLRLFAFLVSYLSSNVDWSRRYIELLTDLGRWPQAAAELAYARALHGDTSQMLLAGCRLDARMGRLAEAEADLRRSLERDDVDEGEAAAARAEIDAARASLAGGRHPSQAEGWARERAREDERRRRDRETVLCFQSIGQTCEFGLVQRASGAEPLGLFQFESTSLGSLDAALSARLRGLGDPEFMEGPLRDDYGYRVRDRRWGLGVRALDSEGRLDPRTLVPDACRHLRLLRDMLVDDLEEAAKIVVISLDEADTDALIRLHETMRGYGPVSLLCVLPLAQAERLGHDGVRVGDLVAIGPGLHVGYLSWLGRATIGGWRIQVAEWVALCGFYRASVLGADVDQGEDAPFRLSAAPVEPTGVLVFDGDSIAVSHGVAPEGALSAQVAHALAFAGKVPVVGCGGRPVRECDRLFEELVLPQRRPGPRIIVFHAGDNDIALGSDAAAAYGALRSYVGKAHRAGFQVLVSTALQRFDFPPPWQAELAVYNALMLANDAGADAVVDYGGDPVMGPRAGRSDPALYQADGVHPTAGGYAVLCAATASALRGLLKPAP